MAVGSSRSFAAETDSEASRQMSQPARAPTASMLEVLHSMSAERAGSSVRRTRVSWTCDRRASQRPREGRAGPCRAVATVESGAEWCTPRVWLGWR